MSKLQQSPLPEGDVPKLEPCFGQPEDAFDLLNKYGTYNVQPTNESENSFPMIAQALPTQWRGMHIRKEDLDRRA